MSDDTVEMSKDELETVRKLLDEALDDSVHGNYARARRSIRHVRDSL